MDISRVQHIYETVGSLKEVYTAQNERRKFIDAVFSILINDLPNFKKYVRRWQVAAQKAPYPFWRIEMLDTVDDMFDILKSIFYDAAFIDTALAYYGMEKELEKLFTPVDSQLSSHERQRSGKGLSQQKKANEK